MLHLKSVEKKMNFKILKVYLVQFTQFSGSHDFPTRKSQIHIKKSTNIKSSDVSCQSRVQASFGLYLTQTPLLEMVYGYVFKCQIGGKRCIFLAIRLSASSPHSCKCICHGYLRCNAEDKQLAPNSNPR